MEKALSAIDNSLKDISRYLRIISSAMKNTRDTEDIDPQELSRLVEEKIRASVEHIVQ